MLKKAYLFLMFLLVFLRISFASAGLLTGCGDIMTPGEYWLNDGISSSGTCFNIYVNDVVIDCQNNVINYSETTQGYGIYTNASNVTIKNCRINQVNDSSLSFAIYFEGAVNGTIFENVISTYGNRSAGIYLKDSSNLNVSFNSIYPEGNESWAIYLVNSSNNYITDHSIEVRGVESVGIELHQGSKNNSLVKNEITTTKYSGDAIYLHGDSNENLVFGNIIITQEDASRGIYLNVSSKNNITNNEITTSGNLAYGIYFDAGINNIIEKNNITTNYGNVDYPVPAIYLYSENSAENNFTENNLKVFGNGSFGVYLRDGPKNNNFLRNNILIKGNESRGFYIENSSNNYIGENVVVSDLLYGKSGFGVVLALSSNNTIIRNNITTFNESGFGIYLYTSSNEIVIENNITTYGDAGFGIYLYNSSNNNLTKNNILTNGSLLAHSIYLFNFSNGNYIWESTINTKGNNSYGVYLHDNSSWNVLTSNIIETQGNNSYAIYFVNSGRNSIRSSILNSTHENTPDIYVYGGEREKPNSLVNTTFNDIGFDSSSESYIGVYWYLDVYVKDTNNQPISGATVSIKDAEGSVQEDSTDSSGYLSVSLMEYWQNVTDEIYLNNYTINASKSGYYSNSTTLTNFNTNKVGDDAITLILTSIPSSSGGSSGGGGGGGSSGQRWTNEFLITADDLNIGKTIALKKNERVKFNVLGEAHYVGVVNISTNSVTIEVASNPQNFTLLLGETKKFNFNNDDYYDLSVTLVSISSSYVNLSIKSINEKITTQPTNGTEQNVSTTNTTGEVTGKEKRTWLWILVIVVIVVIVGIVYYIKKRKNRF